MGIAPNNSNPPVSGQGSFGRGGKVAGLGQADHSHADRVPEGSAKNPCSMKEASWVVSQKKVFRRSNPRKTLHPGIQVGMPMPRLVVNFGRDYLPLGKRSQAVTHRFQIRLRKCVRSPSCRKIFSGS
jgi:hypothetical protein